MRNMSTAYLSLAAALSGVAAVWAALWLFESVVPDLLPLIPMETSSLIILVMLLVVGAVVARAGRTLQSVAFLAGSGTAWAVHEVDPLSLCQSGALFRPCAPLEYTAMVLPPLVLVVTAAVVAASAVLRTRSSK
jgi:hypothetical protein